MARGYFILEVEWEPWICKSPINEKIAVEFLIYLYEICKLIL